MPYISISTEKLHYLQMGNGPKLLLAFHGYGEDAEKFRIFEQYLGDSYTILSFDLPHHGSSLWGGSIPLTADNLAALVKEVCNIFQVDKVSLMGYSIGGRVCLSLMAAQPLRVDRMLLMGTDGLKVNNFYYFFTRTIIGKWIFAVMVGNSALCFRIARWLRRLRLISDTQLKLLTRSLQTTEKRLLLLRVWPGLSLLVHRTAVLKRIVRKHNIPISIFMGAYDKLLPPMLAERFADTLATVKVFIPQKGHRIFDNENARQIAHELL